MTGWEEDKLRYESDKMTIEEQVWYIFECFENRVIANETAEHGLNHELDAPQMSAADAVQRILILIQEG